MPLMSKVDLFAAIRRDSRAGMSVRAMAGKYKVSRRTVRAALAFESRNPAAKAWERRTRDATLRTLDTPEGPIEFWHETAWVSLQLVAYDTFTRNLRTGEEESNRDVLAFRDASSLVGSLDRAGLTVLHQYGDWQRQPLTTEAPEIILIAQRV
jgi:hypothetical protein